MTSGLAGRCTMIKNRAGAYSPPQNRHPLWHRPRKLQVDGSDSASSLRAGAQGPEALHRAANDGSRIGEGPIGTVLRLWMLDVRLSEQAVGCVAWLCRHPRADP